MEILDLHFHSETLQERIVGKLDSLRLEDFTSPNTSLNDSFANLTAKVDELLPRSPYPFQSDHNKRRILHWAVAAQSWATANLDRTNFELPHYSNLIAALAFGSPKTRCSPQGASPNFISDTFYTNLQYGRYPSPRSSSRRTSKFRDQRSSGSNTYNHPCDSCIPRPTRFNGSNHRNFPYTV